jgi:hypothetical protein
VVLDKDYWPAPPASNTFQSEALFIKGVTGEDNYSKCHPFVAGRTMKAGPSPGPTPNGWRAVILNYDWLGGQHVLGWEYIYGPYTDRDYEPVAMDAAGGHPNAAAVLIRVRKNYAPDEFVVLVFHQSYYPSGPSPDWVIPLPAGFIATDLRIGNYPRLWIAGHSLVNGHYAWRLQGYALPQGQPAQLLVDTTNNFGLAPADCYAKAMTYDGGSDSVYVTGSSELFDGPHNALTARYDASGAVQWAMTYPSNTPEISTSSISSIRLVSGGEGPTFPVVDWVFVTGYAVQQSQGATENLMTIAYRQEDGQAVTQALDRLLDGAAQRSDRGLRVQATAQDLGNGPQPVALVTGTSQNAQSRKNWITLKYDEAGVKRWEINHPVSGATLGDSTPAGLESYLTGFQAPFLYRVFVAGTSEQLGNDDVMTIHYQEVSP